MQENKEQAENSKSRRRNKQRKEERKEESRGKSEGIRSSKRDEQQVGGKGGRCHKSCL